MSRVAKLTGKHLPFFRRIYFLKGSVGTDNLRDERKIRILESVRFEKFTLLIYGIHKSINKIKFDLAPDLGVKSVHVFWVYELLLHPEGLTSAEIAAVSMVDRSLVSREIETLKREGYVTAEDSGKKRSYNARITLTEKGKELAEKIKSEAIRVQESADVGVTEEELESFYSTLEKLYTNFAAMSAQENN